MSKKQVAFKGQKTKSSISKLSKQQVITPIQESNLKEADVSLISSTDKIKSSFNDVNATLNAKAAASKSSQTLNPLYYGEERLNDFVDTNTYIDVANASGGSTSPYLWLGAGALAIGAGIALADSGGNDNPGPECNPSQNDATSLDLTPVMSATYRSIQISNDGGADHSVSADGLTIEQSLTVNTLSGFTAIDLSGDVIFGDADCGLEADLSFTAFDGGSSEINIGKVGTNEYGYTGDGAEGVVHNISVTALGSGSQDVEIINRSGDATLTITGSVDVTAEGEGDGTSATLRLSGDIRFDGADIYAFAGDYNDSAEITIDASSLSGEINNLSATADTDLSEAVIRLEGAGLVSVSGNITVNALDNNAQASIDVQAEIEMLGGDITLIADSTFGESSDAVAKLSIEEQGIWGSVDEIRVEARWCDDLAQATINVANGEELSINDIFMMAEGTDDELGATAELFIGEESADPGSDDLVSSLHFNSVDIDMYARSEDAVVTFEQNRSLDAYGVIDTIDMKSSGDNAGGVRSDLTLRLYNNTDDDRTLQLGVSRDNEMNFNAEAVGSQVFAYINGDIHLSANEIEVSAEALNSKAYLDMSDYDTVVTGSIDGITVGAEGEDSEADMLINASELLISSVEIKATDLRASADLSISGSLVMEIQADDYEPWEESNDSVINVQASATDSLASLSMLDSADVSISGSTNQINLIAEGDGSGVSFNADFDSLNLTTNFNMVAGEVLTDGSGNPFTGNGHQSSVNASIGYDRCVWSVL